jgi:hypothetical protein
MDTFQGGYCVLHPIVRQPDLRIHDGLIAIRTFKSGQNFGKIAIQIAGSWKYFGMMCVYRFRHKKYAVMIDFSGDGNKLYHFILQIADGRLQSGWVIALNVREILKYPLKN